MVSSVAIGIGCRRNTPAVAIADLVRDALTRLPHAPDVVRLYSIDRKANEPGIREAAGNLGYDIGFVADAALAATEARLVTRSARVRALTGTDCVAEAAALAGAGASACIVVPRIAANGATCAIAAEPAIGGDP